MKDVVLGLDIGSVSMKGVLIDTNNNIINKYYTKNKGLILTVKEVMSKLKDTNIKVKGAGCTGSGKELIGLLIGCDILESEIISHYLATITLYPNAKTIIDVGGEDSKLLLVQNKNLTSFSMNRDCGGGTGAMIESIANRMGIVLGDIGTTALKSKTKVIIPSKCGIFAQSAVVSKLNKGIAKEDILMGVCRGLVGNYFAMLSKGKRLKPPYIFQGATAKNIALIKCFEDELKEKVIVPDYPEFMGALGVALLVKEELKGETKFKGFKNIDGDFTTKIYYGTGCSNECEITQIFKNGEFVSCLGNRCEKCKNIRGEK